MRVNHRRADIAVPEQLLYGPDIVPVFKQMGRERMAQRMGKSPASLSPRCERPRARLFVALIRGDDACIVVR
jgi:hypothetical protein